MGMGLNIEVTGLPVYTCPSCGDTFDSQAELDAHIRAVHIAGIPEWFSKYWPALALTGIGVTLFTFWWIKKK